MPSETSGNTASDKPRQAARLINVSENHVAGSRAGGGAQGAQWTKLLAGGGGHGSSSTDDAPPQSNHVTAAANQNNAIGMNDLSGKHLDRKVNEAPKVTVKPLSKWGRMFAKSQEPIQESPEDDVRNNLKKTDSTDSGILRSNNRLDQIGEETQVHRDNAGSLGGPLSAAEQHMLTSLYDIRLEIKEEMDNLGQKINRIDGQISEILRFFSPSSTPCSSSSTYPSSKFNSPQNLTTSVSVERSAQKPQTSPPYRVGLASGLRVRASGASSGDSTPPWGHARGPPASAPHTDALHGPSSPSSDNASSSSSDNNSRRSSKSSSSSQEGGGGGGGGGGGALVNVRPAPDHTPTTPSSPPRTAYQVPADEDSVHVKDRDLDIL